MPKPPPLPVGVIWTAEKKALELEPVTPLLEAKLDVDAENKQGWTLQEIAKDAFRDGFRDGIRAFRETFGEELEEAIDWNLDAPIKAIRIPGLGWKVYTIRLRLIAGWLKRFIRGIQGGDDAR